MKHTPGPWTISLKNDKDFYAVNSEQGNICILASASRATVDKHANVRLIAAAPELLEALELAIHDLNVAIAFTESISKSFTLDLEKTSKLCLAAVAKATGGDV